MVPPDCYGLGNGPLTFFENRAKNFRITLRGCQPASFRAEIVWWFDVRGLGCGARPAVCAAAQTVLASLRSLRNSPARKHQAAPRVQTAPLRWGELVARLRRAVWIDGGRANASLRAWGGMVREKYVWGRHPLRARVARRCVWSAGTAHNDVHLPMS